MNIKGALTQRIENGIVGGIEDKPTFVLPQEALAHPCSCGSSGTAEVEQGSGSLRHTVSPQARGKHDFGRFVAVKGVGLPQLTRVAIGPFQVGLVDQDKISQFQKTGLFCLDAVATSRSFHDDDAIGNRSAS